MSWREAALCSNSDSDLFFDPALQEEAAKICAECSVSVQCLLYAQTNRMTFGVWGGRTAKQRRKMPRLNGDEEDATVSISSSLFYASPLSGG